MSIPGGGSSECMRSLLIKYVKLLLVLVIHTFSTIDTNSRTLNAPKEKQIDASSSSGFIPSTDWPRKVGKFVHHLEGPKREDVRTCKRNRTKQYTRVLGRKHRRSSRCLGYNPFCTLCSAVLEAVYEDRARLVKLQFLLYFLSF